MSSPRPAQAQGIFCPTSVAGQSGIALSNGTCTNGKTGAFSNAALASEALTDLSQSSSQEASLQTTNAIATRREEEAQRCPEGFERVAGACRRVAAPATPEPPPPRIATGETLAPPSRRPRPPAAPAPPARVTTRETLAPPPGARPPKRRVRHAAPPAAPPPVTAVPPPIYKAPPPVAVLPRYGAWATGWGDYERRTGTGASSINCCQQGPGVGAGGLPIPLVLTAESKAVAGGVLGGVDMTFRSLVGADDGLIAGLLTGGLASHVNMTTTSVPVGPTAPGNLLPGTSTLSAHLDGPSLGAYLTYFNGGFSSDLTFRADFLHISESFTDVQAFTNTGSGFGPVTAPFAGNGSANLINLSTTGNLNYRFYLANGYWIEPTGGFLYVASNYDSGAAQLGLADGHLLRLQAGARFGSDFYFDRWRVTVSLTGLAYDDVSVTGGVFQGSLFGPANTILAQQGELKGQGILAFNIDHGNGVSTFVQGDVRGGENLVGGGGRAGVRIQW